MLEGLGRRQRAGLARGPSSCALQCPHLIGQGRKRLIVQARAARYDRRKPPPPDLPSLLFDQRIVYLGMPLVPAVTELMVAELLYLEKQGATLPIEMLINSSGTTRQDGEILSFDSEGVALTSTMGFVKNPISTVNMGLAVGWSCVVLSFGRKGWRKSLPHSLAMIQQPRVPPTGQRQAIEVHIKWREVLDYKRELLRMMSIGTGLPVDKLDADMQRPLYMRPRDALDYGIIDEIIQPNAEKAEKAAQYWIKSGRAESEGRLEQWQEYLSLQEEYALKDSFRKVVAQNLRNAYRETSQKLLANSEQNKEQLATFTERLGEDLLTADGEVRLPFSREGIRMAVLNAERYAERNVRRQVEAKEVAVPDNWRDTIQRQAAEAAPSASVPTAVDYDALIRRVEAMGDQEFAGVDLDQLVEQFRVPA
ncbi:hypothetical protein VOLCADRAFT_74777 [Volvox carteri f. nagariensis]|uniref:ATP-dependent Clp protease proteolytic subunit n=1 Tax=Volvox carteri f. nagariensis TaxID=3068 RepID=D8TWJ5_VOLCA|nr:uncharacterized protein VOLCADRAFT_74777 [Volvox carteri f. nagariensis]EFJ48165.1 hypothetical protein VOLCADRAFT_74777 [Volvox carteri f. nagariensis]|eukprot:XP_002950850.1 hypothetical protein VOLCADRAFT_74777 [Volvox carteri f. nagariensis]